MRAAFGTELPGIIERDSQSERAGTLWHPGGSRGLSMTLNLNTRQLSLKFYQCATQG